MSFWTRLQPMALSGFLALTATSCPPDRFFSFGRGEGDDGPLACPTRDLIAPGDGPNGLGHSLDAFAARGLGPELFRREDADRLRSLNDVCSPQQIHRFGQLQEAISERIATMPPAEIATTLEGLYRQAYVYDAATHTMAPGTGPAHQDAKRRLDVWIAAVEYRAYGDEGFFDAVWAMPRIRTVMALNSPHLTPLDRGDLEETFRAESGGDDALLRVFRERPMDGWIRMFDWLRTYDGRDAKFFEAPIFRSQAEVSVIHDAHFDRERMLRLSRSAFPAEAMERLLEERGFLADYRRYVAMDDDALIRNYYEVLSAITPHARPASRRRLLEAMTVMWVAFVQRGLDPQNEVERRSIRTSVRHGYSRPDAELLNRLQSGLFQYTHDRLDDYRARHGLLAEYRSLYRDMLTHPLEDVFSHENTGRYGMWGALVLNRSLTRVPILLEDLDAARREVQSEIVPTMAFGTNPMGFEFRDPTRPQWFAPGDLGLCHSLTGGPLSVAGMVTYHGRSAEDLICSNVELIAFLPEDLHHDHALATAIGVFGVITVRGLNIVGEGTSVRSEEWTPGALLETLTHEATHVEWFRDYFDNAAQRLPMLALNERRAYAVGGGYLSNYFLDGLARPEERTEADASLRYVDDLIAVANETVEVPRGQMDPDYWEPRWDTEPFGTFSFQPANVLRHRRWQERLNAAFGDVDDAMLDRAWDASFGRALACLSPQDRRAALDAATLLASSANTPEAGFYFLESHPLTRAVNDVRAAMHLQPLPVIDLSAQDWRLAQRQMSRGVVDYARTEELRRRLSRP